MTKHLIIFASPGKPAAGIVAKYEEALKDLDAKLRWIAIPGFSKVFKEEVYRLRDANGNHVPNMIAKYAAKIPHDTLTFVGYSAGCWFARDGLFRSANDRAALTAAVMLDGAHAALGEQLNAYVSYANEGRLIVLHTDVQTHGYPSTTETAEELAKATGAAHIIHRKPKPGETQKQQHGRVLTEDGPMLFEDVLVPFLKGERITTVEIPPPAPDTEPDDTPTPDTLPAPGSGAGNLWAAVVARATWDLENGVREDLGRNDGHRIREYIEIYNEQSKRGLGPPLNWCALGFNAWITEAAEQLGIDKPVEGSSGAQATMHQFKALGLWVVRKNLGVTNLLPGNVVVWKRPPKTWTGHIGIIESYDPDKRTMHTIEANSGPMGDRVARMKRSIDDPRLFGVGILNDGSDESSAEGDEVPVVELPVEVITGTPEETWEGSDPVEGPELIVNAEGEVRGIAGAPVADGKPVMPSTLIGWLREVGVLPKKLGNVFGDAADAVADAVEEPPDEVS